LYFSLGSRHTSVSVTRKMTGLPVILYRHRSGVGNQKFDLHCSLKISNVFPAFIFYRTCLNEKFDGVKNFSSHLGGS